MNGFGDRNTSHCMIPLFGSDALRVNERNYSTVLFACKVEFEEKHHKNFNESCRLNCDGEFRQISTFWIYCFTVTK